MRIGIIAPSVFKNSGGLEYQVLNLTQNINFEFYFFKENTGCNTFGINKNQIINFNKDNVEKTKFEILYLYKTKKINLFVLFFSWHEVEFWYNVFKDIKVPFIYSERTEPELIKIRWSKEKRDKLIERADGIHFFFDEYAKDYSEFKNKILINKSVSLKSFSKNKFIYVGSINYFPKQTNIILNIFKNYPNLILNICGEGDFDLINYYKDISNIIFHGYLDENELIKQYRDNDCLIVPSRFEGCPNCILDAINLNKPIIAYKNCGGAKNLLETYHSGILSNEDELEETIINFSQNNCNKQYFKKWEDFILKIGNRYV